MKNISKLHRLSQSRCVNSQCRRWQVSTYKRFKTRELQQEGIKDLNASFRRLQLANKFSLPTVNPHVDTKEYGAFSRQKRVFSTSQDRRVNDKIKSATGSVRLILDDGTNMGELSLQKAKQLANERKLDLVQVSPVHKEGVPVCKLQDLAAIQYKKTEKRDEEIKKQKTEKKSVKEVQIGTSISDNDLNFKWKQMQRFLEKGRTVRLLVQMKSSNTLKQNQRKDRAFEILEITKEHLKNCGVENPSDRKIRQDLIRTMFAPVKQK
mmetsp:Transcript_12040/g.14970  ORF Transcript_12040/g.14970 Transcript_12040/m.14970 type:complete len:265 (-) Transcript_12040:759-1553(-)